MPVGTHTITAKATDNLGLTSISNPINLTVTNNVFIGGKVTYGTTPANQPAKYVSGVALNAVGASSASTVSDSAGIYLLNNLTPNAAYTVTPAKTGDANGITSFDSTLVLRHVAAGGIGPNALNANQQLAADVDGVNGVTSFDATLILRYVAANGQTAFAGQTGNWKFLPAFINYQSIGSPLTNENYTAFLVGEPSGDWMLPANLAMSSNETFLTGDAKTFDLFGEQQKQQAVQEIEISLPQNAIARQGDTITIPVALTNNGGAKISAFSFDVKFNPALLQPADAGISKVGSLSGNCEAEANVFTAGKINIAGACAESIAASGGTLLNLRFTIIGRANNSVADARALKFWQTPVFEDENGNRIAVTRINGNIR